MSKALTKYLKDIKDRDVTVEHKIVKNSLTNKETEIDVIKLSRKKVLSEKDNVSLLNTTKNNKYKVTVKLWMTSSSLANSTFHNTWNNGKEMPFRIMYGTILEERKTMYKMSLKADITNTDFCMKCGKALTNEVSKLYGLGPECGSHYYINPLSEEEFEKHKEAIANKLTSITWEGWIPKIAIISMEALNETN